MMSKRKLLLGMFAILVLVLSICMTKVSAEELFPMPKVGQVGKWEAERAQMKGEWKLFHHPSASGGIYVSPSGEGVELFFPVESLRPTDLRVYPLLWRHSDRRPARRFPHPLERRPGPDVIDYWQTGTERILFFTSPGTGRVVAFDPQGEKVIKSITLGGYPADLVVSRKLNRIYVANSTEEKVQVLNPSNLSLVNEIPVSGAPWSLVLEGQKLYVGCLKGRKVVLIDTETNSVEAEVSLPSDVAHVEVVGKEEKQVVAWFEPILFDIESFLSLDADREKYVFSRKTSAESGEHKKPGWMRFSSPSPHTLRIDILTEEGLVAYKTLDMKSITGAPKVASTFPSPLKDTPGPDVMVTLAGRLFFTSPSTGKVGVLDIGTGELTGAIDVGGYLSDIAFDPTKGKLFVSDALSNRVVAIDAVKLSIEDAIDVPKMPIALEMFIPPEWLKGCQPSLFVACWDAKKVVNVNTEELKITGEFELPTNPQLLKVITPPDNSWWPLIPSDRIDIELRARLAVFLSPKAFKLETLQELSEADVRHGFSRRSTVSFDVERGIKKRFTVDNAHTVQITLTDTQGKTVEERWVDVSSVTDPLRIPLPPLSKYDKPGPITISLDDGEEYPWRREVWMTPDQMQFLVAETEEFWRWNAPTFHLEAGKHTIRVRAYSPFVQVDALKVKRSTEGSLRLNVKGSPPQAEGIEERYRSLFYYDEPVRFELELENLLGEYQRINMVYEVSNYMDEVEAVKSLELTLMPKEHRSYLLEFPLESMGRFTLIITLSSPYGQLVREHKFIRVPKLEHPRMLFSKEEIPGIKDRIAEHSRLFSRYFEWLLRQCEKEGFLPAGIAISTFVPKLPEAQHKLSQQGGWRRYDLGWRMLAVQFSAIFAQDAEMREQFRSKIQQILKDARTDGYCMFHHHGPFFPGAVAALFDLVAATPGEADEEVEKLREFFNRSLGDMNLLPWTLASIEEPLTVKERAILWHVGMWLFNVDRYFRLHQGKRGGRRWLNERTGCHCPYAGYGYSLLYLSNIFKERRLHKKLALGFLTHSELIHPIRDNRNMLGPIGPLGEPIRWIDSVLCKNPLEKHKYNFEKLLEELESEVIAPEKIDEIFSFKEAASTSKPMAFVVPIALALGWYDPKAPEVEKKELPPTVLFDVEGDVIMRSSWSDDATEVYFTCGIRDHVYRHQPTHLRIAKGGEFLLSTASSYGDDGNPNPGKTWGNVVVIEPSGWIKRWGENLRHPRGEEYPLINRFSEETFRYIIRDRRVSGFAPAEGGFGGGLDMHGHTESLFLKEGEIIAYETWPQFDYVAGDATNSWNLGLAQEVLRQVVFVKPDVVVVYDRVLLGTKAKRGYWVAATGQQLEIEGKRFTVRSGSAVMHGQVVLPENPLMQTYDPQKPNRYTTAPPFSISYSWFLFDGRTKHQKVLEIHPSVSVKKLEYLLLMQIGEQEIEVKPMVDDHHAGVFFETNGKRVEVRFRRNGPVGGKITLSGRELIEHSFVHDIDDSYRHYIGYPGFEKWMSEPQFRFLNLR